MRAVQYGTLASIVDFIYHGEAEVGIHNFPLHLVLMFVLFQVRKEELESFLEIAGELSVKGMTKEVCWLQQDPYDDLCLDPEQQEYGGRDENGREDFAWKWTDHL